ncbi:MAG: hypothetical protein MJZ26_09780 [Fibrobacter sp.]|nr:hypothetical protein [Fibrobacter sp.]
MAEIKNKPIADTLNARVRTPWVWLVLVVTVGLTALFYFSQKPELVVYPRFIKSLAEYQLQESYVMRTMDRIRSGTGGDTLLVQTQTMSLRESAVSFSREMDEMSSHGIKTPSYNMVNRFEKEVLGKVAGMRRYATGRCAWMVRLNQINDEIQNHPAAVYARLHRTLDSAKAGYPVGVNFGDSLYTEVPDSLKTSIIALLQDNEELAFAWSRFNNEMAVMYSEDLMQFFHQANQNEIALKSKIPMAFYFLSLVLMLSTFFFIFRSRQ